MRRIIPILSITGSDGSGGAGIQADVKTIADMGGYPVTALTAITVPNSKSLADIQYLPTDWVVKQVRAIIEDRKSTRLNSSHANISYAVFCLKKNNKSIAQI